MTYKMPVTNYQRTNRQMGAGPAIPAIIAAAASAAPAIASIFRKKRKPAPPPPPPKKDITPWIIAGVGGFGVLTLLMIAMKK